MAQRKVVPDPFHRGGVSVRGRPIASCRDAASLNITLLFIVGAASIALAPSAAADVYKCVVDGTTTYQDEPCRGSGSALLITRPPAPAVGKGRPGGAADAMTELRANVASMERERRSREVAYETDRLEREIVALEKSRATELSTLRDKAAFANYNQHGAIWERAWVQQAIVAEMQKVNDKYDSLLRAPRDRLAQLGRDAGSPPASGVETKGSR